MPRSQPSTDRPRYRRISTRLWGDERVRKLSKPKPNAQTLWIFLLIGPQTSAVPGLFFAGERALAEMLGWSLHGFRAAFFEIEGIGLAHADWSAKVVWIPNAVKHNPPESPNVVRSWRATLADIPECELKARAITALRHECERRGQAFLKAFEEGIPDPSGKPLPNQDQEQDQEQEQELRPHAPFPESSQPTSDQALSDTSSQRKGFERFWSRYPRQEGKARAWAEWRFIAPNEAHAAEIAAAAGAYAESKGVQSAIERGETQFIKFPSNWLKETCWTDVPTRAPQAPRPCQHHHDPPCEDAVACTAQYLRELRGDQTVASPPALERVS